jgi:hypothetical protein
MPINRIVIMIANAVTGMNGMNTNAAHIVTG